MLTEESGFLDSQASSLPHFTTWAQQEPVPAWTGGTSFSQSCILVPPKYRILIILQLQLYSRFTNSDSLGRGRTLVIQISLNWFLILIPLNGLSYQAGSHSLTSQGLWLFASLYPIDISNLILRTWTLRKGYREKGRQH